MIGYWRIGDFHPLEYARAGRTKKYTQPQFLGIKKGCKSRNYLIYTLCCGE